MIIDFGESESVTPINELVTPTFEECERIIRGTPKYLDPILFEYLDKVRTYKMDENYWN